MARMRSASCSSCLLRNGFVDERLEKRLRGIGVDLGVARKCLEECLRQHATRDR